MKGRFINAWEFVREVESKNGIITINGEPVQVTRNGLLEYDLWTLNGSLIKAISKHSGFDAEDEITWDEGITGLKKIDKETAGAYLNNSGVELVLKTGKNLRYAKLENLQLDEYWDFWKYGKILILSDGTEQYIAELK